MLSGYPVICIVGRSRGCNDRFGRNAVPISGIYRLFRNSGHFGRLYGNGDPVILTVWFASKCEKLFNRFVPDLVKFFFVPMLTLLVTLPVAMIFLGPVATFGSTLISEFTLMIREFSPLLAGAVVGFTWQILVIFGMHWGFIPVYINNVQTLGYDNVMMPFFACTFATSAVVLAMFFKTKDKKIKEMAIPNFISGIFGVTEPAIYGMLLPLKKPFIISVLQEESAEHFTDILISVNSFSVAWEFLNFRI